MTNFVFWTAVLILVATFLTALLFRRKLGWTLRILCGGTMLSLIIMMPVLVGSNYKVLNLFNALQVSTLNANFENLYKAIPEGVGFNFVVLFGIVTVLAPIVSGGLFASFFDGFIQKLSYGFQRKRYNAFIFSELNEKSMLLAKSIRENDSKAMIVFYNTQKNPLKKEAISLGFIVVPLSYEKMIYNSNKKIQYFMISDNQDRNLTEGLDLLNFCKSKKDKIKTFENLKLNLFTEQKEAEQILNSIDKQEFTVAIINEKNRAVNNLLYNYPLYSEVGSLSDDKLSVLIIGAGSVGVEFIKGCCWAGQLGSKFSLDIKVIDSNASHIKKQLELDCPELFKWNYNMKFFDCDVTESGFEEILKNSCMDVNYVAVCINDDELSIRTALYLRGFYIRTDKDFKLTPTIVVRISDETKAQAIKNLTAVNREKIIKKEMSGKWGKDSKYSQKFNLLPFGTYSSIYSYDGIVNNLIDNLSINVHATYEKIFSGKKIITIGQNSNDAISVRDIMKTYNHSEIDKRSNRANALHTKYKLRILGFDYIEKKDATADQIQESKKLLEELKNKIADKKNLDYLGRLEHDRWVAFQGAEGWHGVTVKESDIYAKEIGDHKNLIAKLHPCICSFEDLQYVVNGYDPKVIEYDLELIRSMPYILGLENSDINISNVEGILIRSKDMEKSF